MNIRARHRLGSLMGAFVVLPATAQAHLVSTGLGPIYDGMSQFALSPEEIFPVAALALFAGLRGPARARSILFLLPSAWLLGSLLVACGVSLGSLSAQVVTAAIFLVIGGILVTEAFQVGGISPNWARVPRTAEVATAVLLGLIRGNVDVAGFVLGEPMKVASGAPPLLGVVIAVFVLTALGASVSLPLKAMWARIAVCVTGSWCAALGLLLVGWSIHLGFTTPP